MAEPLELTIIYGERRHAIRVEAGDADAAAEAKDRIGFIVDLFIGTDAKRRPSPKPPIAAPKPVIEPPKPITGGAK